MVKTYKILIISGVSPYKSANLGKDQMDAFLQAGHQVDFLTKYSFDGMEDNMLSVYDHAEPVNTKFSLKSEIKAFLKKYFRYWIVKFRNKGDFHLITVDDESKPPVSPELMFSKLRDNYDFIVTLFWHGLINSSTLNAFYNRYKCPILIQSADMAPMTGGCYYFGDCNNYRHECKNCPADSKFSRKGQANFNFLYKKGVYSRINCVYLSNSYVCTAVKQSGIIDASRVKVKEFVLNENTFKPAIDIKKSRKESNIPEDCIILFAGAANIDIPRKGFDKLVEAVNYLPQNLNGKKIVMVLAGSVNTDVEKLFNKEVICTGFLNIQKLAEMYSISDVFISPSIDDAGPSMVNQSLMSGTPVVSFDIGTAQELVINGENGYRAPNKDSKALAEGIILVLKRMETSEAEVRQKCREVAMNNNSLQTFNDRMIEIYNEIAYGE